MKINLFINNDLDQPNLIHFFLSFKNIEIIFQKMESLETLSKQKNILVCTKNLPIKYYKKITQQIKSHNLSNCCLFLPLSLNKHFSELDIKKINYPINILYFERYLIDIFDFKKFFFKNLELQFDNNLINIINKKQTRLTEIESKIIKMLFNNQVVLKNNLKSQVLKQHPNIESKSLESHLYRLRKKLSSLDNKIKIISFDNNNIKII